MLEGLSEMTYFSFTAMQFSSTILITKGGEVMALMNCPECGKQISDKAVSCPKCGCPASEFHQSTQEDTRTELDRIADEIFWRQPLQCGRKQTKELMKGGGIFYDSASAMLTERGKEYRKGKKLGKYPDTQYCPYCGSQDIEPYEEPGITVTSKANVFGGMYITSSNPSTTWMRCKRCGGKWKPKKIK